MQREIRTLGLISIVSTLDSRNALMAWEPANDLESIAISAGKLSQPSL